ncbi:unnamed protein product [Allacma fusca]|uniref:G-protein coupled receptors family 1 profile domain-containing protein n=1 Tax=Allacma fusca TaxID=39272 RepID=A0A8J2NN81_9HEXA|nr:unnamed protein product [Allacma fusca]
MEPIINDTLKLIMNGSSSVHTHHGHKSNLGWFLFSYQRVNQVYTPILFLFGTIGNCLSVTVFCTAPTHRHLSSSYYLSALAISDTGFLINLVAVWLEDLGYHVITTELTCPLVMYLGQVTCFLSVWLTVSFTVERFFAVCYPLTRPTVCTVARAKKVITVLTLVALVAFSYVWLIARALDFPIGPGMATEEDSTENEEFDKALKEEILDPEVVLNPNFSTTFLGCSPLRTGREKSNEFSAFDLIVCNGSETDGKTWNDTSFDGPNEGETMRICYVREEHVYFSSIANQLDSLLTLIFPFFIITYLNVRIALCVWKLKDQRQNIMAVAKISTSPSNFQYQQPGKNDHPSSGCRFPSSRSSPLLNGISGPLTTSSHPPMSLNNCKSYRINLGSSASLNACNSTNVSGPSLNRVNRNHSSSTSASEARVTKTLLLVSTVFLVLNLPAHAVRAVAYVQSLWGLAIPEELQAVQQWTNILFNTNFGVNFLLYCLSGRNFRKSLWSIIFNIKPNRPTKPAKRNPSRVQKNNVHQFVNTARSPESVVPRRANGINDSELEVQTEEIHITN